MTNTSSFQYVFHDSNSLLAPDATFFFYEYDNNIGTEIQTVGNNSPKPFNRLTVNILVQ